MTKIILSVVLISVTLLFSGCSSTLRKNEKTAQQTELQTGRESVSALSQLNEIKEELKQLRNAVEELQFESENGKRRQHDLFQDIDRRLVDIERNQQVLNPQISDSPYDSGDGVGDGEIEASTTLADQVIVVDSNTNDSSTSRESATANSSQTATHSGSVSLEEQNMYEQAFEFLKQSRYEDSIQGFQHLVDTWPSSQLADDAYYWMSEARYVNREFEHALSGFRTVVTQYPDSQRVPEALLKVGYIQYDIGEYNQAAETFRDILSRFPGHQVTISAQTRLRRIEQTIQ